MVRHFLQLYLLIVLTLAAVSWGQEKLWQNAQTAVATEHPDQAAALALAADRLREVPSDERRRYVRQLAQRTGLDLELFDADEIAGEDTLAALARGAPAFMSAADGTTWILRQLAGDGRVLAFRYDPPVESRTTLEWVLAFIFYAAIALVIMMWLWPLSRDLRQLELTTMKFGDRNWSFDADIGPRSQVYPLAQAFRRMAARIDSLIGSHKDMSNAVSHEIKTPLARMRFEIEMARTAAGQEALAQHLDNINTDIAELNAFVTATLDYAILERAEVALNLGEHDFTTILPALAASVARSTRTPIDIRCEIAPSATSVRCDAHLLETIVRNLLYNAVRYAQHEIVLRFDVDADERYTLTVDDDGPGIAPADRERVFASFVQLDAPRGTKTGYGLGLAIVKRMIEWHGGSVHIEQADLGGARFVVRWTRR
jgi:two-component system OmpR family sensor kinase